MVFVMEVLLFFLYCMKKLDDNAGHVCIGFGFEGKDVAIPLHFPTPDHNNNWMAFFFIILICIFFQSVGFQVFVFLEEEEENDCLILIPVAVEITIKQIFKNVAGVMHVCLGL